MCIVHEVVDRRVPKQDEQVRLVAVSHTLSVGRVDRRRVLEGMRRHTSSDGRYIYPCRVRAVHGASDVRMMGVPQTEDVDMLMVQSSHLPEIRSTNLHRRRHSPIVLVSGLASVELVASFEPTTVE